jgi:PrtD family type I secretion system ABC transporter
MHKLDRPFGSDSLKETIQNHILHIAIFSLFFNVLLFSSPIYMLQIYNRILPARAEEALLNITLLIGFMLAAMGVLDAVRHMVLVRLSRTVENKISRKALGAALTPARKGGQASNHQQILRDIDQIRALLTKGHLLHAFDVLWLPVFLIVVALLHPLLALVAIIGVCLLGGLGAIGHAVVVPTTVTASSSASKVFSFADQMIAKADVMRGLGMAGAMTERWDEIREQAAAKHAIASHRLGSLTAASKALKVFVQSITLGVGAYLAIHDSISAGAIVAASILVGRALGPLEASIVAWHELLKARESYQRLKQLHQNERPAVGQPIVAPCRGALVVEHLSCVINDRPILRDVSFEVEPGQLAAIIGPSGAGKSTLARHLVGAWSSSGAVRLDGLDVASMTDEAKRRFIGYLPQESQLFDGTIIETIGRFGKPTAKEVLRTAELAGIHEMILRLPDDYGARIGVDGCLLSGGQRQRLALGRAIYGDPALLVLDEPCAHLDESGERRLIQTIQALKQRKVTICLITHKINFIRLADHILVLSARGEARFGSPRDIFARPLRSVPMAAAR